MQGWGNRMKLLIFPTIVGISVLVCSLTVALVEDCMLQNTDPKFDCWISVQITAVFAGIGAALAAITAGLARGLLLRFMPIRSVWREGIAAAPASIVLVLFFDGIVRWEIGIGGIAGMFFGWLFSSFVICGACLVVVKHLIKEA